MSCTKDYNHLVLAGDIGGTNTNLALLGEKNGAFDIVFDRHYKTREQKSLAEPLARFIEEAAEKVPGLKAERFCVSGAGPVVDGRIAQLTNAPWGIDGPALEKEFGLPTRVINDFTAISYGVCLLDPEKPEQILRFRHCDGSDPRPDQGVKLVVGAGTGLGVGFLTRINGRMEAFPSEGGHFTLPVYDAETREFQGWLEKKCGFVPGAEAAVSGIGTANIFSFLAEKAGTAKSAIVSEILTKPQQDWPRLISMHAAEDRLCDHCMDIFVKLYARVAADLSAIFIPTGGLYLAGGIVTKEEKRFIDGQRFMAMYEQSYREHIRAILRRTPVMAVKDYSISLYGAANAAIILG